VPLRGIFITGTSPPDGISKVLDRMDSQGMFVLELFKRYESILDLLANRGSFEEFKAHSNDYKGDEVRFIHFQKN
jgi:hypothetical protein